jgi:predicted transcriptional regulator of viral defense system
LGAYALRFKSQSLIQRLGYLIDLLVIPVSTAFRNNLLTSTGKNICYLGQPSRWKKRGEFQQPWNIVDNIPHDVLLAEIEAH